MRTERPCFRFQQHDTVYLDGSAEPYTVVGQMFIALMSEPREECRYYLTGRAGAVGWITEDLVLAEPKAVVARQSNNRDRA